MPSISVQLHHLVLFVLFVFTFNVFVLAYLTGALSLSSVSYFISKLKETRNQVPPWQRPDRTLTAAVTTILSAAKSLDYAKICPYGYWLHEETVFCKETETAWTHLRSQERVGSYRELWIKPETREIALYDAARQDAIVLRQSVAFHGKGATAQEALRVVFDEVLYKNGRLFTLKGSEKPSEKPQSASVHESESDDSDGVEKKLQTPEHELLIDKVVNVNKDCVSYWFVKDDSGFCKYKNKQLWLEIGDSDRKVRFVFKELYHDTLKEEAGIFDEPRMIVIVLLKRHALIGHPSFPEQALDIALETDEPFLSGGIWLSDEKFNPLPPIVKEDASEKASVLVMISAFRDVLCSNTLKELFENALNPDRVRVSVVDQAADTDQDCLDTYCQDVGEKLCRRSQVSRIRWPLTKSRGVMMARFLQQTLIQKEEFCLQIDSHMVFPKNWDRIAIDDWLGANNEMAVMTTYPNRAVDRNDLKHSPVRCNTVWGSNGNTIWGSNVVACGTAAHNMRHDQKMPHLIAFFGAGIAFSKCHANLVVPYDPYMAFLFKGEEYNRSARLWTHGYDLYAPKKNYAYHFYDDDPRPEKYKNVHRDRSFFAGNTDSTMLLKQSEYRWQAVLGMIPPDDPVSKSQDSGRLEKLKQAHAKASALKNAMLTDIQYFGIGNKRSLREYQIFSGINLVKHTNKDLCDQIGKMPWVPWNTEKHSVLGKDCPLDASRDCCKTTLDKIMEIGGFLNKYIGFSNEDWASHVRRSGTPGANGTNLLQGPIVSKGWTAARALC